MNNLSSKLIFIILTLNIIVTGVIAIPPSINSKYEEELHWREQKKAAPCSSPQFRSFPRNGTSGPVKCDRGFGLIFLAAIIIMVLSYILETLGKRHKKPE